MTSEDLLKLEDQSIRHYVEKHNAKLEEVNKLDLDSATPFQLAKSEYLYSQAMVYATSIASYYRKQQRYYEAQAEQIQADTFEAYRADRSGIDSKELSRKAKGIQLEIAGKSEGNYERWKGITQAYENSINSLKDVIKAIKAET